MKIRAKETIIAVLISIPIIIAKLNSDKPDKTVRPVEVAEIGIGTETEIEAEQLHFAPCYDYSFIVPYEPQFEGYDFIPLDAELQNRIHELCVEYEIDYGLIISVIKTESEFQWITGDNGQAIGYMQIWPYWWQGTADLYGLDINKPIDNVHLGIIILTDALDDNGGDLSKALKQYNSGNPNSESNHYVDRIYKNYEWFEERLDETT